MYYRDTPLRKIQNRSWSTSRRVFGCRAWSRRRPWPSCTECSRSRRSSENRSSSPIPALTPSCGAYALVGACIQCVPGLSCFHFTPYLFGLHFVLLAPGLSTSSVSVGLRNVFVVVRITIYLFFFIPSVGSSFHAPFFSCMPGHVLLVPHHDYVLRSGCFAVFLFFLFCSWVEHKHRERYNTIAPYL